MSGTRIGLIGGTFDPIHIGHLIMAENALEQLGLDRVIFAPAGTPPHKAGREISPEIDRLEMVRLAIAGRDGFVDSRIDLDEQGPSYTWELLERLRAKEPGAAITFIMGGDSLREFSTWSRPGHILELARIAVIERPGLDGSIDSLDLMPGLRENTDIVATPSCSISSTEIRWRVARGMTIRYLVPEPVRVLIEERGLYREGGLPGR